MTIFGTPAMRRVINAVAIEQLQEQQAAQAASASRIEWGIKARIEWIEDAGKMRQEAAITYCGNSILEDACEYSSGHPLCICEAESCPFKGKHDALSPEEHSL